MTSDIVSQGMTVVWHVLNILHEIHTCIFFFLLVLLSILYFKCILLELIFISYPKNISENFQPIF